MLTCQNKYKYIVLYVLYCVVCLKTRRQNENFTFFSHFKWHCFITQSDCLQMGN